MNKLSLYAGAIILLFIAAFYIVKKNKKNDAPQINLSAIPLKNLDGTNFQLSRYAGKPLVVNFWGTWCGPCRQELPGFEIARKKYDGQINFVMVSDEPAQKIIKFKEENNYFFIYAQSQKTFKDLGFVSVPVTYFYDAKANLIAKKNDPLTEEELNGFIAEMIK